MISAAYLSLCSFAGVTLPNVTLSGTASVQVPGASSTVDSSQSTSPGTVLASSSGSSPTSGSSKNGALGFHKEMVLIGYPFFLLLPGVLQVI